MQQNQIDVVCDIVQLMRNRVMQVRLSGYGRFCGMREAGDDVRIWDNLGVNIRFCGMRGLPLQTLLTHAAKLPGSAELPLFLCSNLPLHSVPLCVVRGHLMFSHHTLMWRRAHGGRGQKANKAHQHTDMRVFHHTLCGGFPLREGSDV